MKKFSYVLVKAPADYPGKRYSAGRIYEHTLVWWQHTKIVPPAGYQIHHKNEIRNDNRFENLELVCKSTHVKLHNAFNKPAQFTLCVCAWCLKPFKTPTHEYKKKSKTGQKNFYCSCECVESMTRNGWKPRLVAITGTGPIMQNLKG